MDWPVCKLQVCNLILGKYAQAEYQKVNKHPKFYDNFNILRLLEHFEYEMNWTFVMILLFGDYSFLSFEKKLSAKLNLSEIKFL